MKIELELGSPFVLNFLLSPTFLHSLDDGRRSSGVRHWRRVEANLLEQNKTSKSRQERELGRGREREREER
jgi:hypothetical protein